MEVLGAAAEDTMLGREPKQADQLQQVREMQADHQTLLIRKVRAAADLELLVKIPQMLRAAEVMEVMV